MKEKATKYNETLEKLEEYFGSWIDDKSALEKGRMTKKLYPYTELFRPLQINSINIKNRIIMAPMGNINVADETGRPSLKMIEYFTERARGGAGLITSGLVPVGQDVEATLTEKGGMSLFPRINRSRTVFSGWRTLAESLHAHGSRFFIQLTPGVGRVGSPECLATKYKLPVSSSWNPNFYIPSIPCRPLFTREAKKIVRAMGQGAADAQALLIDGVYIHGHEGYLLEQFSNPAFNRRLMGRYRNHEKFGIDIVNEIRKRCGNDYPIMYRIDLSLMLNAVYKERMKSVSSLKKFRKERTVEMTLDYMVNLARSGVDIFDVDLGCYENWWLPHPPGPMPPGCFLDIARIVKDYLKENNIKSNKGIDIPIAGVGKLGYPDLAEGALREGKCDMIMLGRPLLADPYWPQKAYSGKVSEIIPCIGDQEGCLNEFLEGGHPQCGVNPRTSFEELPDKGALAALKKKKVAVIGAGPGGVMCAATAAERGHKVVLYDTKSRAGGLLLAGSSPKIKFDLANYVDYLNDRLKLYSKKYKLTVNFNKKATVSQLKKMKFDAIVIATGSLPASIQVKGIDSSNVVQAVDVLLNPKIAKKKENIIIVGGGVIGCETAYFLAGELKKTNITIVEKLPALMKGVCTPNRGYLIHYLEKMGVNLLNCSHVKRIKEGNVIVESNVSKTVPDPYITWSPLIPENVINPLAKQIKEKIEESIVPADLVILAVGAKAESSLYEDCVKKHAAHEVHIIGDSFSPAKVFEATKSGYAIAGLL
ncbi:FAD-dependent oxidoreductase [Spirochaetota bacterium]